MYGVILAGGSGTRLWPLSRERFPKQCIKAGSGKLSLFQEAAARLQDLVKAEALLVVTHRDQKEQIALQLAELKLGQAVILEEPLARNTAPAIGLAAWYLARVKGDPGAVMAVLPSDHYIAPREAFQEQLRIAGRLAEKYGLVTFGIRPETPETGYGYIKCGAVLPEAGCRVAAFAEKPDLKKAREYLAAGSYLWNSGIFVFKVDRLQSEYRRLLPELSRLLEELDFSERVALEQAYSLMPNVSIDSAILEKAREIVVLPAPFAKSAQLYQRWLHSPLVDSRTKEELQSLAGNEAEIEDRFGGELSFGTGGMRGVLGAGSRRMNTYVIRRATQGFADYLNGRFADYTTIKVVIAYDSRRFSREFALEAALVLAANGIKVFLFREMRPTPQLSFAIRELDCQGGIIITASHNPPTYNGFKVYDEHGGQIVPARAEEITAAIDKVDYFNDVKLLTIEEAATKGLLVYLDEEMDRRYLERIKTLALQPGDAEMGIVYTPLHGTGVFLIPRLLREMGYAKIHVVTAQADPDPDFPTVKVPNPEERDSFALALALADAKDAALILATDPDADRVGCAVRDREGAYHLLNGNQVGALLVAYLLTRLKEKNALPPHGVIIKTIVTGNLGREIAATYGIPTLETLTGFKFIGEKIREFEEMGDRQFIFGYEESYGYLAGTFVRDKDAVIASALIAEMTAYYRQKGKTLLDVLEELFQKYGYYREELISLVLPEQQPADKLLHAFSGTGLRELAGIKITEIRDYRVGKAWDPWTKKERALSLPLSDATYFALADGSWFCIRPSGTEPKVKFYFAVQADSAAAAAKKMATLKEAVLKIGDGFIF